MRRSPSFLSKFLQIHITFVIEHIENCFSYPLDVLLGVIFHKVSLSLSLIHIWRAAHSLKGAISTFAAQDAFDAAAKLEGFSRPEDFELSPNAYQDLESKVERTRQALESFASGHTAAATPSAVQSC